MFFFYVSFEKKNGQTKKTKDKGKKMDDLCFEVDQVHFLTFCAQLNKQGCDVSAVNTFNTKALVWVCNSPLLQTQLIPSPDGLTCSGFNVVLIDKKKGKVHVKLNNITYLGLLQHCDANRKIITAWSAPTSLECPKLVFR